MCEVAPICWDESHPLTVHLLITTKCNMRCPQCFYAKTEDAEIPLGRIEELFKEWQYKVLSIAIGGGEPLLHPDIKRIIESAKERGFYVAVTTNGTIFPYWNKGDVVPDRVHISFDKIHSLSKSQLESALASFKELGVPAVGINHIITDEKSLEEALSIKGYDKITLLLEKPTPRITRIRDWHTISQMLIGWERYLWCDPCLIKFLGQISDLPPSCLTWWWNGCKQGKTSMSIDQNMTASLCSNCKIPSRLSYSSEARVPYSTLEEVWEYVVNMECPLFDNVLIAAKPY